MSDSSEKESEPEKARSDLAVQPEVALPAKTLDLGKQDSLDLSSLTAEQKSQIALKANEAQIDLKVKAQEASIDVQALDTNLTNINSAAKDATSAGVSFTATHTETSTTGRTEVVIGNTEKAASGKISRSAQGLSDNTTKLALIAAIFIATIALIFVLSGQ